MQTFRDRVAVVTGAGSGIGRALAERFAAEGMKLVVADVDEARLGETAGALEARGTAVRAVRTDVARAADVERLAAETFDAFGAAHVVCNNAGISARPVPVWEQSVADWEWILGINLWGVIHGIRSFVPRMLAHGDEGHVVNTASMAGLLSLPYGAPYHATKHAVVTITESLHHELALHGATVKASVLCPGFVRTRIMDTDRVRAPHRRVVEPTAQEAHWDGALRGLIAAGMPPAEVAGRVLDAIRTERFWILPDERPKAGVRARMESVLAETNPVFVPFVR